MKTYKQILEEVKNINSDKEVKLKDYQTKLAYYNSNKGKFIGILTSKKPETWEIEANKIINGNTYLGDKWSVDKMEYTIKQDEDKIKSNELTNEEEKKIQTDITRHKQELNKLKQETSQKIQADLRDIQAS